MHFESSDDHSGKQRRSVIDGRVSVSDNDGRCRSLLSVGRPGRPTCSSSPFHIRRQPANRGPSHLSRPYRLFVSRNRSINKSDLRRTVCRYALCITLALLTVMVIWAPMASADGRSFRTVGSQRYEILEAKDLVIYSTGVLVRKREHREELLFQCRRRWGDFPTDNSQPEEGPLPDNHAFHDSLDMMFNNDWQLTKYDDFHKMYKVNRLLAASKQ